MPTERTEPALADPDAREFLRSADPILARIIDARPDFRPRAWTKDLPELDAFSTLIFQVIGQQLSVRATRTILGRLEQAFSGRLPTPAEMLAADPDALRSSGMSTRKAATLRAIAQHFVDGRLTNAALSAMSDDDVVATLTSIPGIGPCTAHGFLLVALDRPDVLLTGDLVLRRAVEGAYGFDHLPTDDEMLQLAERWRPYRSLAVGYLFESEYDEPASGLAT
jgi:DNA-3-methyladenine glycosylase II